MASFDIASRLEKLKGFGVSVQYGEHVREEELNERESINSEDEFPTEAPSQQGGKDASPYDAGRDAWNSTVHSSTEKQRQLEKIDNLPAVVPLDCSKFIAGEPADEVTSFCSWKVIQAYPDNFIGNANRPRVCRDSICSDLGRREYTADTIYRPSPSLTKFWKAESGICKYLLNIATETCILNIIAVFTSTILRSLPRSLVCWCPRFSLKTSSRVSTGSSELLSLFQEGQIKTAFI